jgi:hypothetical protein
MSREKLQSLIEEARAHKMSDRERDAQVRSFAYGNTHLENDTITKSDIDQAVTSLDKDRDSTDALHS